MAKRIYQSVRNAVFLVGLDELSREARKADCPRELIERAYCGHPLTSLEVRTLKRGIHRAELFFNAEADRSAVEEGASPGPFRTFDEIERRLRRAG